MCDSGGAYGRNWERNQNRDFMQKPEATVEFSVYNDQLSGMIQTFTHIVMTLVPSFSKALI